MRSGTPYIPNVAPEVFATFTDISGSTIGTYSNYPLGGAERRLVYIHTDEEPYTGKGVMRLLNQDGGLNSVPFIGSKCIITWGWHTGTPSDDQPMWVTQASLTSSEGRLIVELQLANAWELLSHSVGINAAVSADLSTAGVGSARVWNRTTTIKDIITAIVGDTNGFLGQWGYTLLTQLADDGIVSVYTPLVTTRLPEDDRQLLRRLLQMSQSVLTFRASTGATLNYIDPAIPGPYYEYRLGDGSVYHPFFISVVGNFAPIPNRVFYVDQEPDPAKNQVATYVGFADDATSISLIGGLADVFVDPTISSNVEADLRAASHLARIQAEGAPGEIYVPMNCCQELYDAIKVTDARNGSLISITRVGRIERLFEANANDISQSKNRESYSIRIHMGGIGGGSLRIKSYTGSNDIDAAATDMKTRGLRNPFVDSPQLDSQTLSQHYAPQITVDTASATITLNDGSVHAITGTSRSFTPLVDSTMKVTASFYIAAGAGVAAGDYALGFLYMDGAQQGQALGFIATTTQGGGTHSKSWLVPMLAGVTHTLELRAQRGAGTGTFTVSINLSDMITELVAGKNAVYS